MKVFYLIVPPLILNYVEHMLGSRSLIGKKENDEEGILLFDDGFVVGLAYILKLLDQINDFNSLHWFSTVLAFTKTERRKIEDTLNDLRNVKSNKKKLSTMEKEENEKLQQTLLLTDRRLNESQSEFNLLYNNLCSAKILFR